MIRATTLRFYLSAASKIFVFSSDESMGFREMFFSTDLIVLQELQASGT
jgi:hypothetical protein